MSVADMRKMTKTVSPTKNQAAIDTVCAAYEIGKDEFYSSSKTHRLSHPRYVYYYIMNKKHGYSLASIGGCIGRDHTSVMYGLRLLEKWKTEEPKKYKKAMAVADGTSNSDDDERDLLPRENSAIVAEAMRGVDYTLC